MTKEPRNQSFLMSLGTSWNCATESLGIGEEDNKDVCWAGGGTVSSCNWPKGKQPRLHLM